MPFFPYRTPADIGAALRARRRKLGLAQAVLAERIGVSRLWINQVERGKPGASMGLVLRAFTAVDFPLGGMEVEAEAGGEAVFSLDVDAVLAAARRSR